MTGPGFRPDERLQEIRRVAALIAAPVRARGRPGPAPFC